jgi:hypothetical protein
MYRWFLHDSIRFRKSIRWTIEHGHANNFANDYSSVAWWYQSEPHAPFPTLPSRADLLPPFGEGYAAAREAVFAAMRAARSRTSSEPGAMFRAAAASEGFYRGDFTGVLERLRSEGLA